MKILSLLCIYSLYTLENNENFSFPVNALVFLDIFQRLLNWFHFFLGHTVHATHKLIYSKSLFWRAVQWTEVLWPNFSLITEKISSSSESFWKYLNTVICYQTVNIPKISTNIALQNFHESDFPCWKIPVSITTWQLLIKYLHTKASFFSHSKTEQFSCGMLFDIGACCLDSFPLATCFKENIFHTLFN